MSDFVTTTRHDDVLVVEIDNPPVNAIRAGVPEGIVAALDEAEASADVSAVVIRGAGRTFVAGADIAMLEEAVWGNEAAALDLHDLLGRIEDCRKPVIVAMHGSTLGGGLELAMAGHYRIAAETTQLGQPEVNLGIIPGAEGTQRLPRLAGVAKALDMCVTGRPISAADALASGIVDELAGDDLTASAVDFARRVVSRGGHVKTRDRHDKLGSADTNAPLFASARELAGNVRRHHTAPLKVVEAIDAATRLPFDEGCRREREIFFECARGEQAKALIHVFLAERVAGKPPAAAREVAGTPIRTVGIVGAGTMGTGIACACANAGLDVVITDASDLALDAGMAAARKNYDSSVARGRLSAHDADARVSRIRPLDKLAFLRTLITADIVIEAVFEELALKQEVFRQLDGAARPGCILATNTSTLDIDAIASATSRPTDVVGLHFFSPAQVMRLVEIVGGRSTSLEVLARTLAFATTLRKLGVVVGNGPGFVGNRLMFPYMYEAQFLVEEGTTPKRVDAALKNFGMAMGIFAVDDMAGLDVGWRARQALGHFRDPAARKPLVHDRLVEMDRLGQKRGKGWYRYDDGRTATPDREVHALIKTLARAAGIRQRVISEREILDRCIYAIVNEGARALEVGVAARAADIDVIYVNGYGFPGWRGGPMFYADRVGLEKVLARIEMFHRKHGDRWQPAPLLVELATSGRTFRDLDRSRKG